MCEKKDKSGFRISYLSNDPVCPDLTWYTKISSTKKLPSHCPYANSSCCPGYYESLSLLAKMGYCSFDEDMAAPIERFWQTEGLLSITEMEGPSAGVYSGSEAVSNFCPEVSYKRNNLFASVLTPHVGDEIDEMILERSLERRGIERSDWRWKWSSIKPLHFSDCPRYSILSQSLARTRTYNRKTPKEKIIKRFPSPPGLEWKDVSIELVSRDSIKIRVPGRTKKYLFSDIGFTDGRTGVTSDMLWNTLILFAKYKGRIDCATIKSDYKTFMRMKPFVKTLRKRLNAILSLTEDPFKPYREVKGYETKFEIRCLEYLRSELEKLPQ